MSSYRTTLSEFLRARRTQRQPEDVGIVRERGRRVPGLRRDEVAKLAGVSSEYYMRLEQGRVSSPSTQVMDALARALLLDEVAVDYLYRLAGSTPARTPARPSQAAEDALRRWSFTSPAYVIDGNMDVLAANDLMVTLSGGTIVPGTNVAIQAFSPDSRRNLRNWESIARDASAALRYLGDPDSPRFRAVVDELSHDADFARFWSLHEVKRPAQYTVDSHVDGVGDISIDVQNFALPGLTGCTVTVYFAEPGSTTDRIFRALAGAPVEDRPVGTD